MLSSIDWEKFCTTWNRSNSASEVAKTLGISRQLVCLRAHKARKNGVKLKKMPYEGKRQVDWEKVAGVAMAALSEYEQSCASR